MGKLSTKSASHRALTHFVDWIKPEEATEETIRTQADDIRKRIKAKAVEDGLVVRSTPWSGSFAKKTGLRRHMRGNHEVEGQDVDLPFVVSPQTKEGEDIHTLLDKFERYAKAIYPNTRRSTTKSSICLDFKSNNLSYDIVPMLAVVGDDEAQVLLRGDGERRLTSVQKHIVFVKTRTAKSDLLDGRVKFNEGVRLVKWWRELRQSQSDVLDDVPTMLIDLLCAKAFDEHSVDETYTETLSRWFGRIAHIVRQRKRVDFGDFKNPASTPSSGLWTVLDSVNPENNVVPTSWTNIKLQELARWFEEARDGMTRVIAADIAGDEAAVREELVALFGNAIKDHGEAP
ncbi:CBASS oligonucleotide cyclase [Polyangium sp. y55x31]|uniref:CBASS oligonucleotide cyclase n=1 Tax=Polyangium sp. y55x31 TaxID=3042688 RepID=UPI0024823334|nr:CBASS oligonucleotide cyclase [Polyangium sp. y55x31]MDI1480547.1 CBASS oligonucleotide cyclase [Polyangium sp. y55x31]